MSDKLAIIKNKYTYRICWVVDGEEGAWLGDYLQHHSSSMDGTDEHSVATEAVRFHGGEVDAFGLYWESMARTQRALGVARAALKAARSSKPHPEWAVKAPAAGRKAPKGWVP